MYYTQIEDNLILTRHNSLRYEYEEDYDSYDLDYSEELDFDFGDVRNIIHADIKYLFNYERTIDGKKGYKDINHGKRNDLWRNFFTLFLETLWEDERKKVIRKCFDYAEACLFFHRQSCYYCQEDGDCSATSIWKQRIADSSQVINELYKNEAEPIFKKYVPTNNLPIQLPLSTNTFIPKKVQKKVISCLIPYFHKDTHKELKQFLQEGTKVKEKLVFNGNGNLLGDFFRQLFNHNYIIGKKKYELRESIKATFNYQTSGKIKEFTDNYLERLIERNSTTCKKPIANVNDWFK